MERRPWITYREAARRLGVGEATVRTLLRHRILDQAAAPVDGSRRVKAHASIDADSLERARAWLTQRESERAERKRRREQHGNPPDHEHVWLDTATVAKMAGLTVSWVQWQIREERMPATFHGGQYWIRREHAEVIVAARAFSQRAERWVVTSSGHWSNRNAGADRYPPSRSSSDPPRTPPD